MMAQAPPTRKKTAGFGCGTGSSGLSRIFGVREESLALGKSQGNEILLQNLALWRLRHNTGPTASPIGPMPKAASWSKEQPS
jgi:hypothetical protein